MTKVDENLQKLTKNRQKSETCQELEEIEENCQKEFLINIRITLTKSIGNRSNMFPKPKTAKHN